MSEDVYRPPEADELRPPPTGLRRRPLVAFLLSLLVTGTGQLYNGRFLPGAAFYLTFQTLWFLLVQGYLARDLWQALIVYALIFLVALASAVEAAVWAVRHRVAKPRLFHRWIVFLPIVLVLASVPVWLRAPLVPPASRRPSHVPTGAMRPTIHEGELVLVDWGHYQRHPPRRGDLAVFRSPADDKLLLKRVIGLAGERIEMRDGRAIVDGDTQADRWAHFESEYPPEPEMTVVVPPDELFVLGDNRANSRDSRHFGFVPEERLGGRAESIFASDDLSRIGKPLD